MKLLKTTSLEGGIQDKIKIRTHIFDRHLKIISKCNVGGMITYLQNDTQGACTEIILRIRNRIDMNTVNKFWEK